MYNGLIESFNGKLRDECLNMHGFESLAEARRIIERWRVECNETQPHSSLGNRAPAVYVAELLGVSSGSRVQEARFPTLRPDPRRGQVHGVSVVYYAGCPTISPQLSIRTWVNGAVEWGFGCHPPEPNRIDISNGTTYYVRLEKLGGTVTLSVFTDASRTVHATGSPKSVATALGDTEFTHFYAVNGMLSSPSNWEWTTGWIDDIVVCSG